MPKGLFMGWWLEESRWMVVTGEFYGFISENDWVEDYEWLVNVGF